MNLAEKYRPKTLNDVVGQEHVVRVLKLFVAKFKKGKNVIPNMLFIGDAGVGKTSVAKAFAYDLLGEGWEMDFLDLNGSDDRGIDVIRNKVKEFCKYRPISGVKIIFLDEADNLTYDAQFALRRLMEDYAKHTVFILSVNYLNKIIPPIQSRCAKFRFRLLTKDEITDRLKYILENEGIKITKEIEKVIGKLADVSNGRLRDAINILNQLYLMDALNINTLMDLIWSSDIRPLEDIYNEIKTGNIPVLDEYLIKHGYSIEEIFEFLVEKFINDPNVEKDVKAKVMLKVGDYAYYISNGYSPKLQLKSFMWLLREVMKK